jgi:excisionase family DNA binding protein
MTGHEVEAAGLGDGIDLMTADELGRVLRVTTAWVYTQTRAGRIPHIGLGRYVRYRRSAIIDWLRENEGCAR